MPPEFLGICSTVTKTQLTLLNCRHRQKEMSTDPCGFLLLRASTSRRRTQVSRQCQELSRRPRDLGGQLLSYAGRSLLKLVPVSGKRCFHWDTTRHSKTVRDIAAGLIPDCLRRHIFARLCLSISGVNIPCCMGARTCKAVQ